MSDASLSAKALRLRALYEDDILVLPNAWDAASAAVLAATGAPALATTSGGVAWASGRTDGEGLTRDEMAEAVRRIAAAVDVPVTADMEGGYGPAPADVAATVRAALSAGAVGMNLEDSRSTDRAMVPAAEQAERIRAARDAAASSGVPEFVVNARTDVYLLQVGDPAGRFDDVVSRADAYARAGADSLFVPGLLDLETIRALVSKVSIPVNIMVGPGAPGVAELRQAGVRRISVGTAIAQAAYDVARRAATELLESGGYGSMDSTLTYPELNGLFAASRH